jgi:hypothetical protein
MCAGSFPTPLIPSAPFDAILPLARSRLNQSSLGFPFENSITETTLKRTLEWTPCPQPKKRQISSSVTCFWNQATKRTKEIIMMGAMCYLAEYYLFLLLSATFQ